MDSGGEAPRESTSDPNKGLPQLFRSKRLSSDFSEEDYFSCRNSTLSVGGSPVGLPGDNTSARLPMKVSPASGHVAEDAAGRSGAEVQVQVHSSLAVVSAVSSEQQITEKVDTQGQRGYNLEAAFAVSQKTESFDSISKQQLVEARAPGEVVASHQAFSTARKPKLPPLRLMSKPGLVEHITPTAVFRVQQPPLSPLQRSPGPVQPGRPLGLPLLSPIQRLSFPSNVTSSAEISRSMRPLVQPLITSPPVLSPTLVEQPVTVEDVLQMPVKTTPNSTPSHIAAMPGLYSIASHSVPQVHPPVSVSGPLVVTLHTEKSQVVYSQEHTVFHKCQLTDGTDQKLEHSLEQEKQIVPTTLPSELPTQLGVGVVETSPVLSAVSSSSEEMGEEEAHIGSPSPIIPLPTVPVEFSTPPKRVHDRTEIGVEEEVGGMEESREEEVRVNTTDSNLQSVQLEFEGSECRSQSKSSISPTLTPVAEEGNSPVQLLGFPGKTLDTSRSWSEHEESEEDTTDSFDSEAEIVESKIVAGGEAAYKGLLPFGGSTVKSEGDLPQLIVKFHRGLVKSLRKKDDDREPIRGVPRMKESLHDTPVFNSTDASCSLAKPKCIMPLPSVPTTPNLSPPTVSFTVTVDRNLLNHTRFALDPDLPLTSCSQSTPRDRIRALTGTSADSVKRRLASFATEKGSKTNLLTKVKAFPKPVRPTSPSSKRRVEVLNLDGFATKKAKLDSSMQRVGLRLFHCCTFVSLTMHL